MDPESSQSSSLDSERLAAATRRLDRAGVFYLVSVASGLVILGTIGHSLAKGLNSAPQIAITAASAAAGFLAGHFAAHSIVAKATADLAVAASNAAYGRSVSSEKNIERTNVIDGTEPVVNCARDASLSDSCTAKLRTKQDSPSGTLGR